ncbi:MAG: Signal peptidase I (EC [Candidatus Burkholderia crenata]|nr:MAG: Signal peptidase I (EC [Candidatus Burkholderia crenata]
MFLVLMALFRSAIADWNVVPSGSMLPTIREGDRIVVDKMAYDLRVPFTHIAIAHLHNPQRGDIVTVDSSAAHELIVKRLIGLPGDVVAMRDNVLYINGKRAGYQPVDITGVEGDASSPGEYLMLGDKRDDSADSRYFGFFPRNELMGRARRVAYSLDPERHHMPRLDRFGARLDEDAVLAPSDRP